MKTTIRLIVMIFLAGETFLNAQTLEQQQKRREKLERDIEILNRQIKTNNERSEQAVSSLHLIQAQKESRQKLINESDLAISSLGKQINSTQAEIASKQAQLDTLQKHFDRLVLGAYKTRNVKVWYMYILASENMSQAFRRLAYFKNLSGQIALQSEKIKEVKSALEEKKNVLEGQKIAEQAERKRRAKEVASLQENEKEQQKIVKNLKKNSSAYRKSLNAKQKEMQTIDRQIAAMIKEATGTGGKGGGKKSRRPKTEIDYTLEKNFEKNKGKLPWPVDGPITEHFGAYRNKELNLSLFNNGINIACEEDCKVRAVFSGTVSSIMIAPGYGQCILIQHGNYYTSYCKVKNATIRQGEKVTTGQIIGEVATIMGKTQLYFLVWKKQYLDPELWLK